eukprot:g46109.t1
MMGTVKKRCHCSTTKVPNITDLEFDTFIKKSTAGSEQLIIVCVVSLQQLKSAPYEQMIQYLYEENNRNRNQPCVEVQSHGNPLPTWSVKEGFGADITAAEDGSAFLLRLRLLLWPPMVKEMKATIVPTPPSSSCVILDRISQLLPVHATQ